MGNPLKWLHEGVGLWSSGEQLSKVWYGILSHLSEDPWPEESEHATPRLYVEKNNRSSGLSQSAYSPGRQTRVDVSSLIRERFIEIDPEETRRCRGDVLAYRISDYGREAVVQYRVRNQLVRLVVREGRQRLKEERQKLGVKKVLKHGFWWKD